MDRTIRMPATFTAAKTEIETRLSKKRLWLSNYKYRQSQLSCTCNSYAISDVGKGADADDEASFTITINYTAVDVFDGKFQSANKCMVLNVLSSLGDGAWGVNNIQRVWRNDYPSAVAIEDTSGEVYFVYLRQTGLELMYFATIPQEQMQTLDMLHLNNPYKIRLNSDVMFDFIEGDIGLVALRDSVEVVFNTPIPIVVTLEQYTKGTVTSSNVLAEENNTTESE